MSERLNPATETPHSQTEFLQNASIDDIVIFAREHAGSYLLTQAALNKLEKMLLAMGRVTTDDDPKLTAAWDEVAAIVQNAKIANLGPNLNQR